MATAGAREFIPATRLGVVQTAREEPNCRGSRVAAPTRHPRHGCVAHSARSSGLSRGVPGGCTDPRRLLDVGGGHGGFAIAMCHRFPRLRATVLDLPGSVATGWRIVEEQGLAQRVHCREGDALMDPLATDVPGRGASPRSSKRSPRVESNPASSSSPIVQMSIGAHTLPLNKEAMSPHRRVRVTDLASPLQRSRISEPLLLPVRCGRLS